MKREWFKAGDTITTLEGYIKINHINDAGLAWADEYIDTEDGDPEYSGELMLTASDISRRMNDYDGKAHSVVLDRSTEEDDMNNNRKWYAVEMNRDDNDWGTGSYDFEEAKEMLKAYPEGLIAVIEEGDDPVCIEEITYADLFGKKEV